MSRAKKTHFTPREAAQRWGSRLDSVYSLIWAERIPACKRDGRWLIPAEAVEARAKMREESDGRK